MNCELEIAFKITAAVAALRRINKDNKVISKHTHSAKLIILYENQNKFRILRAFDEIQFKINWFNPAVC